MVVEPLTRDKMLCTRSLSTRDKIVQWSLSARHKRGPRGKKASLAAWYCRILQDTGMSAAKSSVSMHHTRHL